MLTGMTIPAEQNAQILKVLCERNQSAELSHQPDRGSAVRVKVRFLNLTDHSILIDHPVVSGQPVHVERGDIVRLFFKHEEEHLAFSARAVERLRWKPQGLEPLLALKLARPEMIEKAQRRDCDRLSVAHLDPIEVLLETVPDPEKHHPLRRLRAMLVNLSETGCGLLVDRSALTREVFSSLLVVTFRLPEVDVPFSLQARARWRQQTPDGTRFMLGMQWMLDMSDPDDRHVSHQFARFIAEEQRLMLRRMRG